MKNNFNLFCGKVNFVNTNQKVIIVFIVPRLRIMIGWTLQYQTTKMLINRL